MSWVFDRIGYVKDDAGLDDEGGDDNDNEGYAGESSFSRFSSFSTCKRGDRRRRVNVTVRITTSLSSSGFDGF